MSIDVEDVTHTLPSIQDADEAIKAVQTAMTRDIVRLPPDLAVQLGNIHRLLKIAHVVIEKSSR